MRHLLKKSEEKKKKRIRPSSEGQGQIAKRGSASREEKVVLVMRTKKKDQSRRRGTERRKGKGLLTDSHEIVQKSDNLCKMALWEKESVNRILDTLGNEEGRKKDLIPPFPGTLRGRK